MLRTPSPAQARSPGRRLVAPVAATAILFLGIGLAASLGAVTPAQAQKDTQRLGVEMPALPVLDSSLNPNVGIGRTAALAREHVVGMIRLIGSLTEGDIVATDGAITATEMPDGGARVLFKDLTVRAGASSGIPFVVALGDVTVDAADATGGAITYRAVAPGPYLVYVDGAPVLEISGRSLSISGEINPDTPILGQDSLSVEGLVARGQEPGGDAPVFTAARVEMDLLTSVAEDGSLNGDMSLTLGDMGIAQGERDPTVRIADMTMTSVYENVPGGWLDVMEMLAAGERLPSVTGLMTGVAKVMGDNALGYSEGTFELTGLEVFVSPTESMTVDRLGVDAVMDEPAAGGVATGRYGFTLDGLRTRGDSLPAAVDLGALRIDMEGSGLDVARLRGFLADTMQAVSVLPLTPDQDAPMPEDLPAEVEARMIDGAMGLLRDAAIGQAELSTSLSGLAIRGPDGPLMELSGLTLSGGWDEDDNGLLDTPARLTLNGLSVTDPDLGFPVHVGRVEIDTASRDIDLAALRQLAVAGIESFQATGMPPGPDLVGTIAEGMTVPGGTLRVALEAITVGTEMNPMGGLKRAELGFVMESAAPEQAVSEARLTFSVEELDAGPMATMTAPAEVIPTAAGLSLILSDLPLPAITRLGMTTASDPMGADMAMEQGAMEMLARHQPGVAVRDLTITAPRYGIEGSGDVGMIGPTPDAVEGALSLMITGLDETMTLLQEHARSDPMAEQMMQQPLMMLVALRGLGRVPRQGQHAYDIDIKPGGQMRVNGTPLGAMMGGPGPGQDQGAPMPQQQQQQ